MSYLDLPQDLSPEDSSQTDSIDKPKSPKSKKMRMLLAIALLAIGAGVASWRFLTPAKANVLPVSGRVEGYTTDISAKATGRVRSVAVREGDKVHKGQVIAELDDEELQAQLQGVTAKLAAARQQEQQAALQIGIIESQIAEAQLNFKQAQGDAQGRIYEATSTAAATEAQLSQMEAQLAQAQAELKLATTNRNRFAQLSKEGAATQQQFDQAQTSLETAEAVLRSRTAAVEAAKRQVSAAQGGVVQAQTTALNPDIRSTRISGLQKQLAVAQSQLAAAQAEVLNMQASQKQVQAQLNNLKVMSPIDGTVSARSVEPGAVIAPGKTIVTLINPNTVYLRGYVPEGESGKVRVGQSAKVYLDSAPQKPLTASISAIDTEAAFTPENIYFYKDRVKQTFGIKINIDQPDGFAKPGMPAEAEIMLEPGEKR